MEFQVEVVTPNETIFSGSAPQVSAQGSTGSFTALPKHEPYVTVISPGILMLGEGAKAAVFACGAGFAKVGPDSVSLLVDECIPAGQIDLAEAESSLRKIKVEIGETDAGAPELAPLLDAQRRAEARVLAAKGL